MTTSFGSVRYSLDTVDISSREVLETLRDNKPAHELFRSAMVNKNIAGVFGFGGIISIAVPIASLISGGTPQWEFVAIGTAFFAVALPIDIRHRRQSKKAIDLYNGVDVKTHRFKTKLYLSGTGARLVIRF